MTSPAKRRRTNPVSQTKPAQQHPAARLGAVRRAKDIKIDPIPVATPPSLPAYLTDQAPQATEPPDHRATVASDYIMACIAIGCPLASIETALTLPAGFLGGWLISSHNNLFRYGIALNQAADVDGRHAEQILSAQSGSPRDWQIRLASAQAAEFRCRAEG